MLVFKLCVKNETIPRYKKLRDQFGVSSLRIISNLHVRVRYTLKIKIEKHLSCGYKYIV